MTLARASAAAVAIAGGASLGCAAENRAEPVSLFAAASLSVVLDEIAALHERQTGIPVETNYASSSVLAKQIDAGAPADVFFSANPLWTAWLDERGRLAAGGGRPLLGNSLVVIAPAKRPFRLDGSSRSLASAFEGFLALGDPGHVPVGVYAREALEAAGWWAELEERIVGAADARAALALVERGECGAGIVYATDAGSSARTRVIWKIPSGWHDPIEYPLAVVTGRGGASAERLLDTLVSSEAREIYEARGFRVLFPPGGHSR